MELTYWQDAQCQFLFIMSVHCRKGPKSKVLRKFPKKIQKFFFDRRPREPEGQVQGRPTASRRHPGAAGARVAAGSHLDSSCTASHRLFTYKVSPYLIMPEHRRFSPETHLSSAATKNPNSGDWSSYSGTLPRLRIAPGVIFIAVAASRDAAGVVLHRGWGLYLRLCDYLSLPWCDLYVIMSIVI